MTWLVAVIGCGGGADDGPTWHGDVAPIVAERCRACHTEGGSAPFALDTYDQVSTWAEAALVAMEEGRMPPWMPDPECRSLFGERLLAEGELETFRAWVQAELPEGEPTGDTPEAPVLATIDPTHVLVGTDGYVSTAVSDDDYHCFMLDGEFAVDQYLTASRVVPGTAQVHHVLVYALTTDQVPGVVAVDEASAEVGYTCFGGPFGDGNDTASTALPIQIAAWVPGNQPAIYPDDLSVRIPAGSRIVMQVHYSAVAGEPAADDATAVELVLQTEPTPFLSTALPLPILSIDIPAGQTDVTFTQTYKNYDAEAIEVRALAGHMHLLGKSVSAVRHGADGTEECVLDIPDWDFNWQQAYTLLDPVVVEPGDEIEISCSYDNDGPDAIDTSWGDGTLDEMCLVYIVTREAWFPTPQVGGAVCENLADCPPTNSTTDNVLSCDAAGGDCGLCVLEEFGECSVTACGASWLPLLDCLEPCGINALLFSGTFGECLRDRCGDAAYEGLVTCLDATLEPGGACEGAVDACL